VRSPLPRTCGRLRVAREGRRGTCRGPAVSPPGQEAKEGFFFFPVAGARGLDAEGEPAGRGGAEVQDGEHACECHAGAAVRGPSYLVVVVINLFFLIRVRGCLFEIIIYPDYII
jgi:hypothetical protein